MSLRLLPLACLGLLGLASLPAVAADHAHHTASEVREPVVVDQVWSRAMPPTAANGAVYFVLVNHTDHPDRLVAASTDRAEVTELHSHVQADGLMRMEQAQEIEIPPRAELVFEPGGYHVMLLGLTQPLVAGERFNLTLELAQAGAITTEVEILDQAPGGPGAGEHGHHRH
ncbi:copper chaperone PCu(A)C [Stutzerimonas tarimensis]|uniref:Copper chaperone PCu(A)C n=1 Tax=Stutzerimonas tarimensis TaxID=1507735 RepID=A0ABV7T1H2_9GAMM